MYKHIIAIVGMPRSGTSWLGQLFDSSPNTAYRLEPIFSYAFKNQVDETSNAQDYLKFFEGIYRSQDDFMLQKDKREKGIYPVFAKSTSPEFLAFKTTRFHNLLEGMLQSFHNMSMISIVRHPCGAINSWLKAQKEFPALADPLKEWRTGSCRKTAKEEFWGFDDWKKVTLRHIELLDKYPEQFKIICYEDLVRDTMSKTKELFDFVGVEMNPQTARFIADCHSRHDEDTYSVYKDKKVVSDWESTLDPTIIDEIMNDLAGSALAKFLN